MIRTVTSSTTQEIYRHEGPLGLASFMELAFIPEFDHLRDEEWPAQNSPAIAPGASMFETIAANDLLLFHPYESFDPVIRMIEEAAVDPDVIAIKQILYRTARQSRNHLAIDPPRQPPRIERAAYAATIAGKVFAP